MTKRESEGIIEQMRDVIILTINPYRIILFGSHATGRALANSDADFLIIEEGSFGPERSRRKEAAKIWQALLSFEIPKDILIYSVDEVKKYENDALHIVGQAMKTGKVLYERT